MKICLNGRLRMKLRIRFIKEVTGGIYEFKKQFLEFTNIQYIMKDSANILHWVPWQEMEKFLQPSMVNMAFIKAFVFHSVNQQLIN